MNPRTQRFDITGPAGRMQVLRDTPEGTPRGVAVLAHPHPLFGGTMDNKVVQTLARAAVQSGWIALRFNFRGVGTSEGEHDDGVGEAADMLSLIEQLAPHDALVLGGFSFGAYVTASVLGKLWTTRDIQRIVLVGTATSRFEVPQLPRDSHDRTLVIHGEQDDTVPLASTLDWARPQSLPVTVVPGVEHFFHGQLTLLKSLVLRHLR
ncbi:MAG: alpha/beta hydrolase [Burkholderiales bacterium]|nr:alpha/beta hydrolase [Burkholderiales bacterium]